MICVRNCPSYFTYVAPVCINWHADSWVPNTVRRHQLVQSRRPITFWVLRWEREREPGVMGSRRTKNTWIRSCHSVCQRKKKVSTNLSSSSCCDRLVKSFLLLASKCLPFDHSIPLHDSSTCMPQDRICLPGKFLRLLLSRRGTASRAQPRWQKKINKLWRLSCWLISVKELPK